MSSWISIMLESRARDKKGIDFLFKMKSLNTLLSFDIKWVGIPGFTGNSYYKLILML